MDTLPIFAIIAAAFLHALWNFILKDSRDKAVCIVIIYFTSLPFAVAGMFLFGLPSGNAVPIILLSAIFQTGYSILLFKGYEIGSLTGVYPVARGSAPIFIFIFSLIFFEAKYTFQVVSSLILICLGLGSYAFFMTRKTGYQSNELLLALGVGLFIAAYSITDAVATRLVGNPLTFFGAMAIFNRFFLLSYLCFFEKRITERIQKEFDIRFVFGGLFAFICYGIVLWAYTVLPVAVVSSLRETSIVFACLIGVFGLRERLDFPKTFMTFTVSLGLILLLSG